MKKNKGILGLAISILLGGYLLIFVVSERRFSPGGLILSAFLILSLSIMGINKIEKAKFIGKIVKSILWGLLTITILGQALMINGYLRVKDGNYSVENAIKQEMNNEVNHDKVILTYSNGRKINKISEEKVFEELVKLKSRTQSNMYLKIKCYCNKRMAFRVSMISREVGVNVQVIGVDVDNQKWKIIENIDEIYFIWKSIVVDIIPFLRVR